MNDKQYKFQVIQDIEDSLKNAASEISKYREWWKTHPTPASDANDYIDQLQEMYNNIEDLMNQINSIT